MPHEKLLDIDWFLNKFTWRVPHQSVVDLAAIRYMKKKKVSSLFFILPQKYLHVD